jgi:hypothetical protein
MEKGALSRSHTQDLQLVANALWAAWLAFCILCLFVRPIAAQSCQADKLQAKIAEIEHELLPRMGAVRLHRVEELEDEVFVRTLGSNRVERLFYLYQVEQRSFSLVDGEVVENVGAGAFSQYVGISQDGEHVYRLAGFPDSEDNFKRLAADYHLRHPENAEDAQSRALYCSQVVFGVNPREWVFQEEQAVRLATDHFFCDPGHGNPFRKANQWLRSYRTKNPKTNLNLSTTSIGDGSYLTRLPLFWAPVEPSWTTPQIRERQIQVNRDGSCHRLGGSSTNADAVDVNEGPAHLQIPTLAAVNPKE